ncbi:hypothetical protein SCH01S_25_01050 [Sphingomonas changbaiensis NBRC 104936]|uniref:Ice-binding protein C-terminal domain-containing protein n=1 Tax=Sphingomonas changbaiensis NBRC 104936 TaxID=1219043 RepID=A0A0E9MNK6_9SPHN|nr:PEP-CTERM sorting domain-containing protein [Sphingomonas changbaiensis]GAO39124.1 hypothetical protein SCH01S_25_01050 [Sphingomonas changbaiensis NBRC 104936]
MRRDFLYALTSIAAGLLFSANAQADSFFFSTGNPDDRIATATRQASAGKIETESADDFILSRKTQLTGGTFTGLLPDGFSLSGINDVTVEIYRVFPLDSTNPPSRHVPTRNNSPSDNALASRDSAAGELSFTPALLAADATAANSVINGIHAAPNQFTGGEGAVRGEEVQFSFTFATPLILEAGHYFFVPQVGIDGSGNFLWLSAPKPIVAPGTPFTPDLQSWIRNEDLAPDWLRIGTDITGQGPFNAAFSLVGATVPEPAAWALMILGFAGVGWRARSRAVQEMGTVPIFK